MDSTYGGGRLAGKFQFVADACRDVSSSFVAQLQPKIEQELREVFGEEAVSKPAAESSAMQIENANNVRLRAELDRWSSMAAQANADVASWRALVDQWRARASEATREGPQVQPALSDEERAFLAEHRGGELSRMVRSAYASMAVKGDASLHALDRLQVFLQAVEADNRHISEKINEEEKKAYGKVVEDPKQLIQMMIMNESESTSTKKEEEQGEGDKPVAAASASSSSSSTTDAAAGVKTEGEGDGQGDDSNMDASS